MPDCGRFQQTYMDILQSGLVEEEALRRHIEKYTMLDKISPGFALFSYIIEPGSGEYRFLSQGQKSISGVSNDDFRSALNIYREDVIETLHASIYSNMLNLTGVAKREGDILLNLAMGKTSKEIGKRLFVSHNTVDTHRRNFLKKLHCSSVVELAPIAFRNGML